MKVAEAFLRTIGAIISWVLNRAKDVVGWVSQNLWGSGCRYWRINLYIYGHQVIIL